MNLSKLKHYLVFTMGALVIAYIFYVVCERYECGSRGWLGFGAIMIAYIICWGGMGILPFPTRGEFDKIIPSLGILWTFSSLYCIGVVFAVIAGIKWGLSFEVLLGIHLALLFAFVVGVYLASLANEHLARFEVERADALGGVDVIRRNAARMNILAQNYSELGSEIRKAISDHNDDALYLCGSSNPDARVFDAEVIRLQEEVMSQLKSKGADFDGMLVNIAKIRSQMQMRKTV